MGWGWKKRKILGSRYLHVSINATQKGPSSFGVKVGPLSWNSRTRAMRLDGPGGLYWQQKRGRREPGTRSGSGGSSRSGRDEKRRKRGPVTAPVAWAGGWGARGAAWTGRQATARARGYYDLATAPGRLVADRRARYGSTPVVVDLFSGDDVAAPTVRLPDPRYDDPRVATAAAHSWHQQMLADDAARVDHAMRPQRLTWLERWQLRARGEDPQAWEDRSDAISAAVMTRRLTRLAGETSTQPDPTPVAVIHDPARTGGGTTPIREPRMAITVTTFDDLHNPDIDPFEFSEQLPEYLGGVQRLVSTRAEEYGEEADRLRSEAAALDALVEYMESAEADRDMVASLREAAESARVAADQAQQRATLFSEAADSVAAAGTRAQAAYGDWEMPRFDRAG